MDLKSKWLKYIGIILLIFLLGFGSYFFFVKEDKSPSPSVPKEEKGVGSSKESEVQDITVIAEGLEIPWEVAFLPDGDYLVTERPGRLLRIGENREIIEISGVRHVGEGGLLGLQLHPNFENNSYIYLYLTSEAENGLINRVERYRINGTSLSDRTVIIDNIPGAVYHDGGRMEFGPDGYLYITTGDAGNEDLAQDTSVLNGKILRLNDDGSIPEDNPFGNAVYSYGHRNPQGLTWDSEGNLWSTEHGRSGVRSGFDELNLIEMGNNYGWPTIQGDESQEGMVKPVIHSGPSTTWAPAGAEFVNGSIFFAGLRGVTLYQAQLAGEGVERFLKHFEDRFGRLRVVRIGPDGFLYVTTSNRDGRGSVQEGDDKLIRINPEIFN